MENSKKNILFVAQSPIDPLKGGVQRVTHILSEEMRNRGHQVWYLCLGIEKEESIENQFYLMKGDKFTSPENVEFTKDILEKLQITYIINQAGIYRNVMDFYESLNLVNIVLYTVHHNCLKCLNLRYREIRLSISGNSAKVLRLFDYKPIWFILKILNRYKYSKLIKRAIHKSDKLVLLSNEYVPELKYYWISEKHLSKITAIYNPLAIEKPRISMEDKEKRIIFVGRLEIAQKRVDRLLEIWLRIHKVHPNWSFDVVGDGSAKGIMEEFCNQNNMKNVIFHGKCDPKPLLAKASIFTLVSDFEGWPMVLSEAHYFGVVPIAFNSFSSLNEMIEHDKSGFIIPAFDVEEYVKKVEEIILNEEKIKKMARYGQNSLNRFHPTFIVEEWEKLFSEKV